MTRQSAREDGFTLVEMMVVTALVGILTGVAVVQVTATRNMVKGDSAMRTVLANMNQAQMMAIQQRRYVRVQFDTTVHRISIVREETTGTTTTLGTAMFESGAQLTLTSGLPDTPDAFGNTAATSFYNPVNGTFASLVNTTQVVKFAPDGTLVDWNGNLTNGTVFTAIPNQGPSARAVTVLGSTGRIRGYRWDGAHWVKV